MGSGGSDYLDFVGDLSDPILLSGMLQAAAATIANFLGFRFYLIPGESRTIRALKMLCEKESWKYFDEGDLTAPFIDFSSDPVIGKEVTTKRSLLRHENWFRKNGKLSGRHFTQAEEILPYLDLFFEQHINRWANTTFPSLFLDDRQTEFYRKITKEFSGTGWLVFSLVFWDSKVIACHFGFIYADSMLWYKPSFDIELSKHSPGEVLIRQLLLLALEKNLKIFDFGLGDESFKMRFATGTQTVKTVGLYPASILTK